MRYPYRHERWGSSIRYLPLVPVTLHGAGESVETIALIDSGAEDNIFQSDVAAELGLRLKNSQEVRTVGYDGREAKAHRITIELQLGRQRWRTPVIFSEVVERRGLLGQIGFFAFFDVTFRYCDRVMDIRRAKE